MIIYQGWEVGELFSGEAIGYRSTVKNENKYIAVMVYIVETEDIKANIRKLYLIYEQLEQALF